MGSLAELVAREFNVPVVEVMLLRHSGARLKELLAAGATVEDYTYTQPTGSRYDYSDPRKNPVSLVVVIVEDRVYGIYRVDGVESEGTTYSLTSEAHRRVDIKRGKPPRPAKRFSMTALQSAYLAAAVRGWERRARITVQRFGEGFFNEIAVEAEETAFDSTYLQQALVEAVEGALRATDEQRRTRLTLAPKLPRKVVVITTAFLRNPFVIAEVLLRANGLCELCRNSAPFVRRSDSSPYLEVHHKVRLADGGEDTVANAIALCPNCHRREHFG